MVSGRHGLSVNATATMERLDGCTDTYDFVDYVVRLRVGRRKRRQAIRPDSAKACTSGLGPVCPLKAPNLRRSKHKLVGRFPDKLDKSESELQIVDRAYVHAVKGLSSGKLVAYGFVCDGKDGPLYFNAILEEG